MPRSHHLHMRRAVCEAVLTGMHNVDSCSCAGSILDGVQEGTFTCNLLEISLGRDLLPARSRPKSKRARWQEVLRVSR
jgi:hypothetical protein